jgi:hypothetical protein
MQLIERRLMPPLGHFSLIRFAKAGEGRAQAQPPDHVELRGAVA